MLQSGMSAAVPHNILNKSILIHILHVQIKFRDVIASLWRFLIVTEHCLSIIKVWIVQSSKGQSCEPDIVIIVILSWWPASSLNGAHTRYMILYPSLQDYPCKSQPLRLVFFYTTDMHSRLNVCPLSEYYVKSLENYLNGRYSVHANLITS